MQTKEYLQLYISHLEKQIEEAENHIRGLIGIKEGLQTLLEEEDQIVSYQIAGLPPVVFTQKAKKRGN